MPIHTSRPESPERPVVVEEIQAPPAQGAAPAAVPAPVTSPAPAQDGDRTERPRHDPSRGEGERYHVRAILTCSALVLVPGIVARLAPEVWAGLPDGVRWTAYACSMLLTLATCALLLRPRRI